MAQVTRCDKCGNLGDGRFFGKMIVIPPDQLVESVRQHVSDQGFNLSRTAARKVDMELDICPDCYIKLQAPQPFMITAKDGESKWEGEETADK